MNFSNDFVELSNDEQRDLNGGIGLFASIVIGLCVTAACDVGNEVCKNKTGKGIGGWVTYGLGWTINKVGQGMEYLSGCFS